MNFIFSLEMMGTAAFAITGALAASRKGMDIFGFFVLALMPAIGGGTVRDVIIDRTPVFWIADNRYVIVALLAALVVYFTSWKPGSRRRVLVWMDAIGLALFATLGTQISLAHETGPLVAILLGVTSAVTGGMIRDVICMEIPLVLSGEVYATAAFASGLTYVAAEYIQLDEWVALGLAVAVGFVIRALAIRFDWSLPRRFLK